MALVRVQYPVIEDLVPADLERLTAAVDDLRGSTSMRIEAGGELFFAFGEPPAGIAEALGLVAAMIILLLAFGSVVAMGLPIATALLGLAVGVGSLTLVAYVVDVPAWAPVLGSMVGLGVGIDYALFILTRHREHLAEGRDVVESVGLALASAGRAVVVAGGTVVVAILGLAVARIPFITAGGIALSLVVLVMVLASITLLPALLGLAGHRVNALRVRRASGVPGDGWRRWGLPRRAARHGVRRRGHGAAARAGRSGDRAAAGLPRPGVDAGVADRAPRLRPGHRRVRPRRQRTAGDRRRHLPTTPAWSARWPPRWPPTPVSRSWRRPGSTPRPAWRPWSRSPPPRRRTRPPATPSSGSAPTCSRRARGARRVSAHIGGQVATTADLGHRVEDRLPAFIAAVVALSVVLLLVVFRSVLVPLKAAVMNLLSVGAAYGVLVMVFQWGWGADLIGLESTVPILSFIPLFMFAILFGLSMDYEVFLLSRVREEYLRTGDNDEAVVRGLAGTGRTITSAALIMVAVFGGFMLGEDPLTKMMGLGLATAIAVDATIVRLVLVPATMKLLGDGELVAPRMAGPAPARRSCRRTRAAPRRRPGQPLPRGRQGDRRLLVHVSSCCRTSQASRSEPVLPPGLTRWRAPSR